LFIFNGIPELKVHQIDHNIIFASCCRLGFGFCPIMAASSSYGKNAIPVPEEKQFLLFYNKKTPRPAFQQQRDVT